MIQKHNNVSFKGIYPLYSIEGIDAQNMKKILPIIKMEDKFPNNDIFIGRTTKNNLIIEVKEKDLTKELLCEEAFNNSDFNLSQYSELIKTSLQMKFAYQNIHPEKRYRIFTEKNIDELEVKDITTAIQKAVRMFNEKFGNKPN